MRGALAGTLPKHEPKRYGAIGRCIYCRSVEKLTTEHIIPLSAGGAWVLPEASCRECAKITGAFEGEFARTILGPLRMLYDLPTRRPKERPRHLPLKVKYPSSTDWETAYVERSICPFLVGLPLYAMPDLLTGVTSSEASGAATGQFWLRGAGFWRNRDEHLQWLCNALGAVEIMPTATINTEPVCLTMAKIAHAYAAAELGLDAFKPMLTEMILQRDFSRRSSLLGGGSGDEPAAHELHDLAFASEPGTDAALVTVRVRILGVLGTPTYHVIVGRRM